MLEEMKTLVREKNSCVPNLFPGAHQGQLPVYAESTLPSLSAVARICCLPCSKNILYRNKLAFIIPHLP